MNINELDVIEMRKREFRYFTCDFETTVFEGQEFTEVWAAACVELFSEVEPVIDTSISDFFETVYNLKGNICLYFHNLKFDGSFIVDYLLRNGYKFNRVNERDMNNNEFKCSISQMGQWYNIIIKKHGRIFEIRDSLKLLPFSIERIGESFQTKHRKLKMEYVGYRQSGGVITQEEREYIANDVYVMKEALEIMFNEGHKDITIGSCCLKEFKSTYDKEDYEHMFPNIYEIELDEEIYGAPNAGEYVRKSYRGGICQIKHGEEGVKQNSGSTYDVNSLYPSMMHSTSGNYYPVGKPCFWRGEIPYSKLTNKEWFVRFRCRFRLKHDKMPTLQIKRNLYYKGTEYLTTSDTYYKGEYHRFIQNDEGKVIEMKPELTMTRMDYERFIEHYDIYDMEILDGCYFYREKGIFDEYINMYKGLKATSKGARRELAKLFLNNLYGKEASSTDSSYKVPYLDDEKNYVRFDYVSEHEKQPGYIPCGSYITSYSREFTISAAQSNWDKLIYCDTDSIHVKSGKVKGITIHPSDFCCWKHETNWDEALFVRQKTYIEHVYECDGKQVDPFYLVKCAGMPERSKKIFLENYEIDDFKPGLRVSGKLRPKRMKGGIVLVDSTYEMK